MTSAVMFIFAVFVGTSLPAQKFGVFFNYSPNLYHSQGLNVVGDESQVFVTGESSSTTGIQLGAQYTIDSIYSAYLAYSHSGSVAQTSIIYPLADVPSWRKGYLSNSSYTRRMGFEIGLRRQLGQFSLSVGWGLYARDVWSTHGTAYTRELTPAFVSFEEGYSTSYTRYRSDRGSTCVCDQSYALQAHYDVHRFVSLGLRMTAIKNAKRMFTLEHFQQVEPRINTEIGPAQKVVTVEVDEPKYSIMLSLQLRYPGKKKKILERL